MYEIYLFKYSEEIKQFLVVIFSCTSVRTLKYLTTAVLMPCHQRTLLIQKHVTIHIRKFVMNAMASPVFWMSYRKQLIDQKDDIQYTVAEVFKPEHKINIRLVPESLRT